jgi:hypothetical protein
MEGIRNAYTMSVGNLKGKRSLRRPRFRRKSVNVTKFYFEHADYSYKGSVANFWEHGNSLPAK